MQKVNLFETERMFCDVYCFESGQTQALHGHPESDKVYVVVSGEGQFTVGDSCQTLGPNQATMAPAGVDHAVVNNSPGRLTVLVFMAPHPGKSPHPTAASPPAARQ